jgi:hypothetical protein
MTSVLQGFCLFFGYIATIAGSINIVQTIAKTAFHDNQTMLLVIFLLFIIPFAIYLRKTNANLLKFTWFLNVIGLIFLSMIIGQSFQENNINITLANKDKITRNNAVNITPNIYYIILDSYTSNQSLEKFWNFDNSEFTIFLKDKGFHLTNSNSNYNWTPFSLSSSLNMSYLNFDKDSRISGKHFYDLLKLIKSSRVVSFLMDNGYKLLNYSFFDVANQPKVYEDYFFLKDRFFSRSLFPILYNQLLGNPEQDEINYSPSKNLIVLNKVKNQELPVNQNFFVYMHLLLPHYPYYFDHNGKQMSPQYANDQGNQVKYLEQLKYTNNLIEEFIETILLREKSKPIIIIQGDHGFRFLRNNNQLSESFTIFNAYFFPDNNYNLLYNSISPVNSFRVLLNKYFGSKLPLLKDTSVNVLPEKIFRRKN